MRYYLLLFLFLSNLSYSQTIKDIEISGINSISRGTILNYLPVESGEDFNLEVSSQIIKVLYKTKLFKDVEIDFIDGKLFISITENPTIKYIDFLNYDDGEILSEDNIPSLIKTYSLSTGQVFIEKNLVDLTNKIKDLYRDNGYYSIKVSTKENIDSANRIAIEIDIQEGNRAKINSFKILGSNYFTEKQLKKLYSMGEADFFPLNYFTNKDEFNQIIFDSETEKLKTKYFDEGFLDFEILSSKVDIDEKQSLINVSLDLFEGKRYLLGEIDFSSNNEFSEKFLRSKISLENNNPFQRDKLISGLKKIQSLYHNKGYAYADVNSDIKLDKDKGIVNVNVDISKNEKVYVGRINISGNTRTQDDVIRREFNILEGQIYSREDLDNSLSNVKKLGYFRNASMEFVASKNNKDIMDIYLSVEETKTGEMSFGLSQSNSTGTSVNAGIKQNNILGTGNIFNGSFSNSSAVKDIRFFFKDPYFNDLGHSISYGLFNKKIDGSSLDVSSYKIDETGGSFGYGIPLDKTSDIFANLNISNIDLLCGSTLASSGYEYAQCNANKNLDITSSLEFSQNTLNDFMFPTSGLKNTLVFNSSIPGSDFSYFQLSGNHSSFYPVSDQLTLNFKTKLAFGRGIGDEELPFYKKYYGGGSSSVKGFDFNSLGPKYPNGLAKGGEVSYLSNISLISPVTFMEDSENMRVAGFIDVGSINENFSDFSIDEMRASTGIALTWVTPLGPLGIYYAQPILKKADDNIESLSFTLGSSF